MILRSSTQGARIEKLQIGVRKSANWRRRRQECKNKKNKRNHAEGAENGKKMVQNAKKIVKNAPKMKKNGEIGDFWGRNLRCP